MREVIAKYIIEVYMKFSIFAVSLTFLVAICPLSAHADIPEGGINNKIEWNTLQTWSLPAPPVQIVHSLDGKKVFILGEDAKVHVFSAYGDFFGSIPVDKGVTSIDIEPYGGTLYLVDKSTNSFKALSVDKIAEVTTGTSPFLGSADAPVVITLFTDFQCPYCSKVAPLTEEVVKNNPGTVKLVLKNLPLRNHKYAEPAARAALAAKEQGKFWEYHDSLFARERLNPADFDTIAKELGLDIAKFKKDMKSDKVKKQIFDDIEQAEAAGVSGTPTIYINGRKLKKRSLEGFQDMIDEELAKGNSQ